jgi:hypothetical protein
MQFITSGLNRISGVVLLIEERYSCISLSLYESSYKEFVKKTRECIKDCIKDRIESEIREFLYEATDRM